jgi:signal transduction histidine kinase
MAFKTVLISPGASLEEEIQGALKAFDIHPRAVAGAAEALSSVKAGPVDIVFVSAAVEDMAVAACIDALAAARPGMAIIVLAAPESVDHLEADLGDRICGAARVPVDRRELALLLRIAAGRIESHRRRIVEKRDIARRAKRRFDRRVDNERFLTVKQVVDKVSTFIGEIAREVEGGVRYFNEIPYFIAIHDRRHRITAANRAYRVLLGRRVGDPSWEVYEGASGTRETCPVGRTFQTENTLELRETLNYRSGAKVPVIVHTAPIYNNSGEVEMVLEVSAGTRDVHQLRDDLRRTQQRYQQLFDAVPCHVAVLDRDMRLMATNRHFNDEFGDQTGAPFLDFFSIDANALRETPLFKTYADGLPHHGEMTLIPENWRRYDMMVWTSPIMSAAGKLLQVMLIFMDITQIRDLQNNLTFLGLMIASISHSIKGVLAGLDAGVYTLDRALNNGDDDQVREGLELVTHMSERIQKITLDILFYAKERELKKTDMAIAAFVDDLYQTVKPRFERRGVALLVDSSGCAGNFSVDTGLLKAALVNVVENALDACVADHQPGHEHRVLLTAQSAPDAVGFSVEDNGMGMTSEQLKKLFTVFYSTKGIKGTGLGLFIADTIVRQHGGDITVESNLGQGSRFCIQLPREARSDQPLSGA